MLFPRKLALSRLHLLIFALLGCFIASTAQAAYPQQVWYVTQAGTASTSAAGDTLAYVTWDGFTAGGTVTTVVSGAPFVNPCQVTLDAGSSIAYVCDNNNLAGANNMIYKVDYSAFPGSAATVTTILSEPWSTYGQIRDVKIDYANSKLYALFWKGTLATADSRDKLIRMDLDGSNRVTIATAITDHPTTLALDVAAGYAYVCDHNSTSSSRSRITRIDIATGTKTTFVDLSGNAAVSSISSVELDLGGGQLYFLATDGSFSASSSTDGVYRVPLSAASLPVTSPTAVNTGGSLQTPIDGFALDLPNSVTYIGDRTNRKIWAASTTSSAQTLINTFVSGITLRDVSIGTAATVPTVSSATSASVAATTATLGGNVTGHGNAFITERGIVYSATTTNADPLISGTGVTKVATTGTTGVFTIPVTGLTGSTGYSFKAYATNSAGTSYTSVATFTTSAPPAMAPTVTTPTSASITGTSATLGGNVTADGGASVTERGIVLAVTSTNSDPLISGTGVTKVPTSGTTGSFTLSAGSLAPGTAYSFKAYATNSVGTGYSSVGSFTTLSNNADLSALTLSIGTLSPTFAANDLSYTATVSNATTATTITATLADTNASFTLNGSAGTSGSGVSVSLSVGANNVPIVVTAQDGSTMKIYSLSITRPAPPPTIVSVAPSSGSTAGGSSVVITGTNFASVSSVTFGGTAATSFTVDSLTQITATAPAHSAGAVDVVVTTGAGTATASNAFYYNTAPVISSNGGGATASLSVAENSSAVTTVAATEADAGQSVSFTKSGADAALFTLSAGGVLSFTTAPDFETRTDADTDGIYEVTVTATDDGAVPFSDTQALSITVTNVNELPSFTKGADQSVAVSATTAQTVTGWATALNDGDSTVTQALSFTITGNTNASLFTVPPTISSNGTLAYTPAGTLGEATLTVTMSDDTSIDGTPLTTASQSFKISVLTVYQHWAGGNTVSPTITTDDDDSDGVSNLLEFAFGTNPQVGTSGPPALSYNGTFAGGGSISATGKPKVGLESIATGADFRALFVRRKDHAEAGLTYTPQFSADMTTWQSSSATPSVLADDGTYQVVSVKYPLFVGGKKAKFFQITVSIAP